MGVNFEPHLCVESYYLLNLLISALVLSFAAKKGPKKLGFRFLPSCPRNTILRYGVGNDCAGVGVETSTQFFDRTHSGLFGTL